MSTRNEPSREQETVSWSRWLGRCDLFQNVCWNLGDIASCPKPIGSGAWPVDIDLESEYSRPWFQAIRRISVETTDKGNWLHDAIGLCDAIQLAGEGILEFCHDSWNPMVVRVFKDDVFIEVTYPWPWINHPVFLQASLRHRGFDREPISEIREVALEWQKTVTSLMQFDCGQRGVRWYEDPRNGLPQAPRKWIPNATQQAALDAIQKSGGISGKQLSAMLSITEEHLRTNIIPPLKRYCRVINDRNGVGYLIGKTI